MNRRNPKRTPLVIGLLMIGLLSIGGGLQAQANFQRGDANIDGGLDLADGIAILSTLFQGRAIFECKDAADSDDDGKINVTDAVYLMQYLFLGGPAPEAPFEECGPDVGEDDLDCVEFAPCPDEDLCVSDDLLDGLLGELPGFSFCLPADFVSLPVEGFEVVVCPGSDAQDCDGGISGCPIDLTGIEPFVDIENLYIGVRVSGTVEDFPVAVTESLFNTTTVCSNDITGSENGAPFVIEIRVPLETRETDDGDLEIIGTGATEVERIDMNLSSSGGLVCTLFAAAEDVVFDLLIAPLETALADLTTQVEDAAVGLRVCR